jgi:hypothetical protein
MNLVFVTFFHGISLPILFPITLFGLVNFYVSEKILFAYYYHEPPYYSTVMNETAIDILKYAPVLMMINGYWLLSNRQMFFNTVIPISQANQLIKTEHKLFTLFED